MAGRWPLVGRLEELAYGADALPGDAVRCVVLTGAAGVGKTRLASELTALLEAAGRVTCQVIATEASHDIPLGSLAAVLPEPPSALGPLDLFSMVSWACRRLAELGPHPVIVVDDAPLLDGSSVAVLQQLRASHPVDLLLTVRGSELPTWIDALCHEETTAVLTLQPLARTEVEELLAKVLDAPVDLVTGAGLWKRTSGNPLLLRELVTVGVESGLLERLDGVWTWQDDAPWPDRLVQVVRTRLASLDAVEREALDVLAVGEPLRVEVVERLGLSASMAALERRGLVEGSAAGSGSPGALRVSHPLYGEALRGELPELTYRAICRRLAAAMGQGIDGTVSAGQVMRVATWCLEAGDAVDPALLQRATEIAVLTDSTLAERLARTALTSGDAPEARLALGHAVLTQGRTAEAEEHLAPLVGASLPPEVAVPAALDVAVIRFWAEGDREGAEAVLAALGEVAPPLCHHVDALRAAFALFTSAIDEARRAGGAVLADSTASVMGVLRASLSVVPALAVGGRTSEAIEVAERAFALPPSEELGGLSVVDELSFAAAELGSGYALALRWAGRIDEAVALADVRARALAEKGSVGLALDHALETATLGGAQLASGDITAAVSTLRIAANLLRATDLLGFAVWGLADFAAALALAGELDEATAVLAEARERQRPLVRLFDVEVGIAGAVVAASVGERTRAVDEATAAAAAAVQLGQPCEEAVALHHVVRLGGAHDVAGRLRELAATTDAPLVAHFALHAEGCAAGDGAVVERAAELLGEAGARLLAAEAAADAAGLYREAGLRAAATRAATQSRAWSARCPGAPRPSIAEEPERLTNREREIADLACRGLTNRAIADRLVVSVRTVESHLQHAYTKLGVSGRDELAPLLDRS